jgi:hypothetical protein
MCSLTFQKMAVMLSRRASLHRTGRLSSRHPGTRPSRSGTCHRARARRRWKATGTSFGLRHCVGKPVKLTVLPSLNPGQRGRGVEQLPVKLTFGKMAAITSVASSSARMRSSSSVRRMTRRSAYGMLAVASSSSNSLGTGEFVTASQHRFWAKPLK